LGAFCEKIQNFSQKSGNFLFGDSHVEQINIDIYPTTIVAWQQLTHTGVE
jgi:prepilin-type processing-associated H-X9-DG protein